jgi:hypothetical protein
VNVVVVAVVSVAPVIAAIVGGVLVNVIFNGVIL